MVKISFDYYCPKCDRLAIERFYGYDVMSKEENYICLWKDCRWFGTKEELMDYQKKKEEDIKIHGTQFKKFAESLKVKTDIDMSCVNRETKEENKQLKLFDNLEERLV